MHNMFIVHGKRIALELDEIGVLRVGMSLKGEFFIDVPFTDEIVSCVCIVYCVVCCTYIHVCIFECVQWLHYYVSCIFHFSIPWYLFLVCLWFLVFGYGKRQKVEQCEMVNEMILNTYVFLFFVFSSNEAATDWHHLL